MGVCTETTGAGSFLAPKARDGTVASAHTLLTIARAVLVA